MSEASTLHVIFGAGPVGQSIMNELVWKGEQVRIINRKGGNFPTGVENLRGDVLADAGFARQATEGATYVYFALNPPYTQWLELFETLQDVTLQAAIDAGAKKFIAMENVYMYGDVNGQIMTEKNAHRATTRKGKLRARMHDKLMQAYNAGKIIVTTGRASDFYGEGVRESALGERAIVPALTGKAAQMTGPLDFLHSQTYMGDIGKAMVILAMNDEANGRAWHIPNAPAITMREQLNMIYDATGHEMKASVMPKFMMNILGIFVPILREVKEMVYQFESDFIVDSSDFERTFGMTATPLQEDITNTVSWYQANH